MRTLLRPRKHSGFANGVRLKAAAAFTLIEMIVSISLMGVILAAGYTCLNAGLHARKTVEARSDIVQRARVALNIIGADLRCACVLSSEHEFVGMDRLMDEAEADNLDFATHQYTPARKQEGDFCEVSYFLDLEAPDAETDLVLWRRRDTTPDKEPLAGGTREPIVRGVRSFRVEYYDGLSWFDEWGDPQGKYRGQTSKTATILPSNINGMPEAVRITLVLGQEATRPLGKRGEEPPLTFQTTVRLNLTPIASLTSSASSASQSGSDTPGAATQQPPQ